jgi:hypothetical protein
MTEIFSRCIFPGLETFASRGSGTHFVDVDFVILSLELCAFEGQFGENLLSYCLEPFTVPQLGL